MCMYAVFNRVCVCVCMLCLIGCVYVCVSHTVLL